MARRKRPAALAAAAPAAAPATAHVEGAASLPPETGRGDLTAPLLALMMFLAPALGVPTEAMLQDTLKSIIVSFAALVAALLLFWRERRRRTPMRWHNVLWLPLLLMFYALGSMVWSHTYLAGVEAIRWFVFSLILWLGLNTFSRERVPLLAVGIHLGAVVASLWAALQFWVDFGAFPQGPHPASTFVNRNFFAEFAVCTLPFGALLLARARGSGTIVVLAYSIALVIVAILMTGTRAALVALWLQVLVILPLIAWRCRHQLAFSSWARWKRWLALLVLLFAVLKLGQIPTGDPKIVAEDRGVTALQRGFQRTASIRPDDSSLGVRMIMWKATLNVIRARPLSGVGAGAWESEIPLYQAEGSQLETDYYVHNEYLQLVAEYGLAGWAFLLALTAWLLQCAWRSWRARTREELADLPYRAAALCSLVAFFVVSNIGFPWRMAATGALFALCLGILAASQARLQPAVRWAAGPLHWNRNIAHAAGAVALGCLALAAFITRQAVESESKIVNATKIALTISSSPNPNDPKWIPDKRELLRLMREGIAINPHYRKITPMAADELAKWGDWTNATWIWESVLGSRPHIVAILANVARGYASTGQPQKAWAYLERAKQIQPRAPAVRSLEVILLARTGEQQRALQMAKEAIADNVFDYDLANAAFVLAARAGEHDFALKAMHLRMQHWPATRAAGYVQLGNWYAGDLRDRQKALDSYRQALLLATEQERPGLAAQVPAEYQAQLGMAGAQARPPAQTSSSSR